MNTRTVIHADRARYFAHRRATTSPMRKFNLRDMGIDAETFLAEVAPVLHELPFDPYDPALAAERIVHERHPLTYRKHESEWLAFWNHLSDLHDARPPAGPEFWATRIDDVESTAHILALKPFRRRASYQLLAVPAGRAFAWRLGDLGCPPFVQRVDDSRSRMRWFAPIPASILDRVDVRQLIGMCCQLVTQTSGLISNALRVTVHLMLTYAEPDGREPAPEGLHQDGAAFIVSALVLERRNVRGGVSKIAYDKSGAPAMEVELQPGEGIFQFDCERGLWHGVSPIFCADPVRPGLRSILGLDIELT